MQDSVAETGEVTHAGLPGILMEDILAVLIDDPVEGGAASTHTSLLPGAGMEIVEVFGELPLWASTPTPSTRTNVPPVKPGALRRKAR